MEDIEFDGLWWLPETPETRIPGTLAFAPDSGVSLDLFGSLKDHGDHIATVQRELADPGVVLGLSSKGKPVTLWECWEKRKTVNLAGFTKTSLRADFALVGEHLESAEETRFTKISAEYKYLDEWAGLSGFSLKIPDNHATHPMIIEHKRPATIAASVEGARLTVEVKAALRDTSGLVGEVAIVQRTWASVEYPEARRFEELHETLHRLRNFLTLGVGETVEPLAVRGLADSGGEQPVDIYYRLPGARGSAPPDKRIHRAEMLFTLGDLGGDLESFLGNWFGKAERLGPVYDLYFATAYGSPAYLDDRFLSLVQGLEAYHRRALGTTELPEEEHEQRLEEIVSAVPHTRERWLRGKLAYSNEPSLRKRLREIMRRDPEVMKPIFGSTNEDRKGFVNKVVDTRNYFTHYDESKRESAATGRQLYEITERLKSVLEACLVREIGLEGDRLKEVLSRKRHFNF